MLWYSSTVGRFTSGYLQAAATGGLGMSAGCAISADEWKRTCYCTVRRLLACRPEPASRESRDFPPRQPTSSRQTPKPALGQVAGGRDGGGPVAAPRGCSRWRRCAGTWRRGSAPPAPPEPAPVCGKPPACSSKATPILLKGSLGAPYVSLRTLSSDRIASEPIPTTTSSIPIPGVPRPAGT